MTHVSRPDTMNLWSPNAASLASAAVVFGFYLATTAPDVYWLDSNEFVAASFTLGIPHPPSHPLYVLLAKLFSLIPLGSIAFRINLLSALFGAAAASGTSHLMFEILNGFQRSRPAPPRAAHRVWLRNLLVFLVSLIAAASPAMWLQAVRAEVYTLHCALVVWALVCVLRWQQRHADNPKPAQMVSLTALVTCGWLIGLGLANHHYLMFLFIPAVACALLVVKPGRELLISRRISQPIAACLGALLLYCYLPIRATADPTINWADPSTPERFLASITAKVFQTSVTQPAERSIVENLANEYFLLMYQLHPVVVALGTAGMALVWSRSWKIALVVTVALVGNLLSTAVMHFDSANPDTWGYLQLSTILVTVLCGVLSVVAVEEIVAKRANSLGVAAVIAVACCSGILYRQIHTHSNDSNLNGFRAPELFQDNLYRNCPPGSLVFASYYTVTFNYWNSQLTDGRRPDITFVQQTFDAKLYEGRPYVESLATKFPMFSAIFGDFLRYGRFPSNAIQEVGATTPVLLEPDSTSPLPIDKIMGVGAQTIVVPTGNSQYSPQWRNFSQNWWHKLMADLSQSSGRTRETVSVLLWHHLHLAMLYLRQAEPELAQFHVELGLAANPESIEFHRLDAMVKKMKAFDQQERSKMASFLQKSTLLELLDL